ncbi:hypothetical protein OAT67_01795 [Bacteriovoracaceae bacterium]|nr:hypothetical protein [Bacteriovoracaceae bacterium]
MGNNQNSFFQDRSSSYNKDRLLKKWCQNLNKIYQNSIPKVFREILGIKKKVDDGPTRYFNKAPLPFLYDSNLTSLEKVSLIHILGMVNNLPKGAFASQESMASLVGTSKGNFKKIISSLKKKGHLVTVEREGARTPYYLVVDIDKMYMPLSKDIPASGMHWDFWVKAGREGLGRYFKESRLYFEKNFKEGEFKTVGMQIQPPLVVNNEPDHGCVNGLL